MHSRAAKRASSPSIDTDKSLKNIKPPVDSPNHRPSVLAIHQNAGVTKKSKGGKTLSSKAKRRQEKAMDRAEAVMDRTEGKIEKSKGRARNVQERAKAWEEQNRKIAAEKLAKDQMLQKMMDDADGGNKSDVEDAADNETGDVQIADAPPAPNAVPSVQDLVAVNEDEIL